MKTRNMILVGVFAALTAVGAFIKIPAPFIPFTLQFFFCAFAGLLLGSKLGMLSQILYVSIGLAGIPIFTQGGGLSYIFQPSFGYLLGLIPAAYIIGIIAEKCKRITYVNLSVAVLAGLVVLYFIGVPYLYIIYKFYLNNPKSINWAVQVGFLTFIGGDLVKTLIVVLLAKRIIPLLSSRQ